ncbi:hypothetical protein GTO27_09410 [Candidatus Bathyarchaeota archaeon]|nr:hypothetical protein [Candidatus Bathyarchaeota archaeon]
MLIHLKGCFTILGEIKCNSEAREFRFEVPIEDAPAVLVVLIPSDNTVESFAKFDVPKEMLEVLQSDPSEKDLSEKFQTELSKMKAPLKQATRRVLNLVKYCFNQVELDEALFSIKDTYWSVDETEWKRLPMDGRITGAVRGFVYLNENTAKAIQQYLKSSFEPFLALEYLHRAKRESNPRHKWIDATIAAELAIKEFLIRKQSDIKTLLLEVPSPPLRKMYGSVLESYVNECSPKLKELAKGAEVRNRLIHRPEDKLIDAQESNVYVQDVEIAIYHLLTLLHPKDPIMKMFYRPRIIVA